MDTNNVRDAQAAGQGIFGQMPKYDIQRVNDPKFSQVPGKVKMVPYPSLEPDQAGCVSWTRQYSLTAHVKEDRIEDAWKLIQYLGGKDEDGQLYTAKRWYLLKGLGFAYPELWQDNEIYDSTSAWADVPTIEKIGQTSRPIEIIKTPWYYDFERNMVPILQKAVTRQASVSDTLKELADHARKVKKDWD